MAKVSVCKAADLADGDMKQVEVDGVGKLAVYRVGDDYFATDDGCTHSKGSLAEEGYLEGHRVTCTWHEGAFDVRTGQPLALPCTQPLKTYPVEVQDGAVLVSV